MILIFDFRSHWTDSTQQSTIDNPTKDYCSYIKCFCPTCKKEYYIYYDHKFALNANGQMACTRGYCGHLIDPDYEVPCDHAIERKSNPGSGEHEDDNYIYYPLWCSKCHIDMGEEKVEKTSSVESNIESNKTPADKPEFGENDDDIPVVIPYSENTENENKNQTENTKESIHNDLYITDEKSKSKILKITKRK